LLARWKDFSPADYTEEPLHHAAQHHKAQVLSYVKRPENVELLQHIQENKMNLFMADIVQEIFKDVMTANKSKYTKIRSQRRTDACMYETCNAGIKKTSHFFGIIYM
jgi:hypothetical protein